MRATLLLPLLAFAVTAAEPEFPLTADSKPQPGVPKGTLIEDVHTADENSVFPGTEREVKIYLPAGLDKSKPAPFMVFQDGVIYQAPVVFDNLIAKKDIPPLVGLFIKPGVVPAANDNALPRFNRSYEYDSVTDTYSRFLIDELLPALEAKHGLQFSTDPNQAAIAGNSSGGICAFMVAWHRPDRFRRVFTGVGTYVGIRGADRLPVLVRKIEPKPLRVFLQSGTGDNDLYCGDWWMANQMMQRSLAWAGYDVNHAWGEGGHNQKHASQIFPDAMRWLWRDWQTDIEIKANPRGESKWRGYEVLADGGWEVVSELRKFGDSLHTFPHKQRQSWKNLAVNMDGAVFASEADSGLIIRIDPKGESLPFGPLLRGAGGMAVAPDGSLYVCVYGVANEPKLQRKIVRISSDGSKITEVPCNERSKAISIANNGPLLIVAEKDESGGSFIYWRNGVYSLAPDGRLTASSWEKPFTLRMGYTCLSPDQTQIFSSSLNDLRIASWTLGQEASGPLNGQHFFELDRSIENGQYQDGGGGICVDTEGRLYVATSFGVQVCDQTGRVNSIIPIPRQMNERPHGPYDVCFGGKDLSELFIACEDKIYKRPTKAKGYISGQMAPIKPAPPKL